MDCSYADYVAAMELTYTQSKTATKLRRRLRTIFCGDLHLLVGKREKKCPSLAHFFFSRTGEQPEPQNDLPHMSAHNCSGETLHLWCGARTRRYVYCAVALARKNHTGITWLLSLM